jgi:hypothetical protein
MPDKRQVGFVRLHDLFAGLIGATHLFKEMIARLKGHPELKHTPDLRDFQ